METFSQLGAEPQGFQKVFLERAFTHLDGESDKFFALVDTADLIVGATYRGKLEIVGQTTDPASRLLIRSEAQTWSDPTWDNLARADYADATGGVYTLPDPPVEFDFSDGPGGFLRLIVLANKSGEDISIWIRCEVVIVNSSFPVLP